ncbi:CgeB family protein [Tritonibacter horizontis]|uniref:Glycosyl transferases group 1 n=1 Tax=Tritonibacter horizontis TaxID=1768241 RepID=A0A132C203_9RHOB|nr:hypothetical protein [Tritonibacter horizontis]KUP94609.1 hypothetical protein TRIHO_05350 [Tritonibacter horizontis]
MGLKAGFSELGYSAILAEDNLFPNARHIVLGGHLLSSGALMNLPEDTVLFNLEQLSETNWAVKPAYKQALSQFEVWDYSERNIEFLKALRGDEKVKHVRLGYADELCRIPQRDEQETDVLFYGMLNVRRQKIVDDLRAAGLNVTAVTGVYGAKRDGMISRSKVVLNMHFYETQIFEIARVSYLLANKKAVVSEIGENTQIDPDLLNCIQPSTYEDLVETCKSLVADTPRRQELANRGYEIFRNMKQSEYLKHVLH